MKIVFDPKTGKGNRYIDIVVEGLRKNNYQVYSLQEIFRNPSLFRQTKFIHVNWFDNLNTPWDFVKRILKLLVILVFNKKLIWTLHNRAPHGGQSVAKLQKLLTYLLVRFSHKIVIHCLVSKEIISQYSKKAVSKAIYIPHPNYIGEYGPRFTELIDKDQRLQLLFVGAVKPYKNIELLIDVVKQFSESDVQLRIAGKASNQDYQKSITDRIGSSAHIEYQSGFVKDERLIELLNQSDLVVLPYDLRSSLNSGTVILAFSYARSVICPTIGTILDTSDSQYLMTYKYSTYNEHFKALTERIKDAIILKKENGNVYKEWGEHMFEQVSRDNNKNLVVESFDNLYNKN